MQGRENDERVDGVLISQAVRGAAMADHDFGQAVDCTHTVESHGRVLDVRTAQAVEDVVRAPCVQFPHEISVLHLAEPRVVHRTKTRLPSSFTDAAARGGPKPLFLSISSFFDSIQHEVLPMT